jgi:hypothetical protein
MTHRHHCPACGRFARFIDWIVYLDEFSGTLVLRCAWHGVVKECS